MINFGKIIIMNEQMISKEIFETLAKTAAIALSNDEAEKLREEMNRQMDVIRQLEAIPVDETIEPVIHGNPYPAETLKKE